MSQLTDKEVFEILSQVLQKVVKINEYFSPDLKENIQVEYGRDNYKYIRADIKWSHPSRQYPPPEPELETCRYCQADMKIINDSDLQHPINLDCPLSTLRVKTSRWPRKPTIKDSLLVGINPDGTPKCKRCKDSGIIYGMDEVGNPEEDNCPDCGGSGIARDTIPSLESLGLDPVEVWEDAPGWSIEIILQKWENGKIVPYFTGKYQTKSLRDPITLPLGTDWRKCIWKRPDEKNVPADGGNGWVPCPECEDDKEEQNEND